MKETHIKNGRKYYRAAYDPATDETRRDWKALARLEIEREVGDYLDLHADLCKRVGLLERMVLRIIATIGNGSTIQEACAPYAATASALLAAVEAGQVRDRIDLYATDPNAPVNIALIQELTVRADKIAEIVAARMPA